MYPKILIPLDMSPLAEQVLPWAQHLAARFNSTVVLFHAIEPLEHAVSLDAEVFRLAEQQEVLRGQAHQYLHAASERLEAAHVAVEHEVRFAPPANAILDFAERTQIDLIAMVTHGRGGLQRWRYGSVASKIVSASRVPVLIVRAQETPATTPPSITRILVPLDRSALAETALEPAQQLARAFDAELLLFHVWDMSGYDFAEAHDKAIDAIMRDTYAFSKEYLVNLTRYLQAQGVRARWQTGSGAVAELILHAAEQDAASLIVMSTHGLSGMSRWLLGSVADRVLRAASLPVLLIRPSPIPDA